MKTRMNNSQLAIHLPIAIGTPLTIPVSYLISHVSNLAKA